MDAKWRFGISVLGAGLAAAMSLHSAPVATGPPLHRGQMRSALCPLVYPVDQSPSARGFHFVFYGNGFFIDTDGYLITAAHVLSQLHGGQAYVLVKSLAGASQMIPAHLVAFDIEHDIALLRATPNPFLGQFDVSFLPLAAEWPERGTSVTAQTLRPSNLKDSHTGDSILENDPSGEIVDYEFSALYRGKPETELFLFSHEIEPGQSGSPVVASGSNGVVGLVEGRWLRENATTLGLAESSPFTGVGAGIPIHYAIWLLQQKGIAWQAAPVDSSPAAAQAGQRIPPGLPVPLSVVAAPYPKESLTGGEVVLDTLVDPRGRFSEIRVVRGDDPFLFDVLAAVRTWTFVPAQQGGRDLSSRIGIEFQFPQSLNRGVSGAIRKYDEPMAHAGERAALPIVTVEPQPAPDTGADGSVILYESVDARGDVTSTRVLQGVESLIPVTLEAAREWRFVPAVHAGSPKPSAVILVFTFRRPPLRVKSGRPITKE